MGLSTWKARLIGTANPAGPAGPAKVPTFGFWNTSDAPESLGGCVVPAIAGAVSVAAWVRFNSSAGFLIDLRPAGNNYWWSGGTDFPGGRHTFAGATVPAQGYFASGDPIDGPAGTGTFNTLALQKVYLEFPTTAQGFAWFMRHSQNEFLSGNAYFANLTVYSRAWTDAERFNATSEMPQDSILAFYPGYVNFPQRRLLDFSGNERHAHLITYMSGPRFFSGAPDLVPRFLNDVYRDDATLVSVPAIQEAAAKAVAWSLPLATTHWSSPRFAYKVNAQNKITKRYCLFGKHAAASVAEPPNSELLLSPSGGPPQIRVFGNVNSGLPLEIPPIYFPTPEVTVSVNALAETQLQSDQPNSDYPFFPLVEQSVDWNQTNSFLLGVDTHGGGILFGHSNPYQYVAINPNPGLFKMANYFGYCQPGGLTNGANVEVAVLVEDVQPNFTHHGTSGNYYAPGGSYGLNSLFIGARRNAPRFSWIGPLNDVFFTGKLLPEAARYWLANRRFAYVPTTPKPGDTLQSDDARYTESNGYFGSVTNTDQPVVRFAEPGNQGKWTLGFYGKRLVLEHSSFYPSIGHVLIDGVFKTMYESGAGIITTIDCDTLDYHTLTFQQLPNGSYMTRPRVKIFAA